MLISNLYFYKNKAAILYLYGFLFALSITLINPWGDSRGEIWTEPKLLIVQGIIILNLLIILRHIRRYQLTISLAWRVGCCLWASFLFIGLISTLLSPFPLRSFWGQTEMGDGWFYWFFVAAFVLTNALVLQLKPNLVRPQLYGFLAGGMVLAVAVLFQVYDWRIDFTATSGQINVFYSNYEILKSAIAKGEMPIGFYTNRGHAGFVLAAEGILTLLGLLWGWIYAPLAGISYVLLCTCLFYTKCRGAILALLVALTYLLICFRFNSKKSIIIICYGVGLLLVSYLLFKTSATWLTLQSAPEALPNPVEHDINFKNSTSLSIRFNLWKISLRGIIQRPLFGWGFDGFGIAHPFLIDWVGNHQRYLIDLVDVSKVLIIGDYSLEYLGIDGLVHAAYVINNKAHNLIMDIAISVGISGLISYISLFIFFLWCAVKAPLRGIEAVAITYLVYTLTWYESGQFSHLGWWGLSIGLGCTKLFKGKKE